MFGLMPELTGFQVTALCRRFARNCTSVRNAIIEVIENRKKGKTQSTYGDKDLLSILLQSEIYSKDLEKTVDELIVFYLAGNETIKTSSANTTCFLTSNPDKKAKFMAEIEPILLSMKGDYINNLTIEVAEDFQYVRQCWNEAMRLQAPTNGSSLNSFCRDTVVKGVDFKSTDRYTVNFDAIHKDPKEWHDPLSFIPERFDSKSEFFKRPDGKPRHPFSYCPFFGGKRICLGKTLAEYMTVFTLPLVLYHFDFEFVNPAHATKKPNLQLGATKTPVIPMKVRTVRKMKQ